MSLTYTDVANSLEKILNKGDLSEEDTILVQEMIEQLREMGNSEVDRMSDSEYVEIDRTPDQLPWDVR